ncbi:MAG: HD domain-containing protein [Patescibacteria group bacterium]
MESELYKKTKQFVVNSFTKVGDVRGIKHFLRTVYWVNELKPDADEAMYIAAVAHDIERAYRNNDEINNIFKEKGFMDKDFLIYHQEKGAKIISDFLKEQNASNELIERVKMLVKGHEVGGNDDQNIIKDADSISYFENNANHFVEVKAKEIGKNQVREKFDWMYNRISSGKGKQIALKWYENALAKLNS